MRLGFVVHPRAGITDSQHHMPAGRRAGVRGRVSLIELNVGRFNRQLAAPRHGVTRIDRQIHDDLRHLSRVRVDPVDRWPQTGHQLDVVTNESLQQRLDASHHRVQIENLRLENLFPAEGEELAGE